MKFSPLTRGFYLTAIHGDAIPKDAFDITDELYESLLDKQIGIDSDGMPCVYTPPPAAHADLASQAKAATRIQRQPIIAVLDGLQASCLVKGEATRAVLIETAKQGLRDITDTDLSDCVTYEDMRLKVKAAYIALAVALPSDLRKAFSDAIN